MRRCRREHEGARLPLGMVLMACLCLATVARGDMGPLEPETNRQGSDFAHFNVVGPNDCRVACDTNSRCKAMTFVPHPDGHSGVCWLKRVVPPPSPVAGMTSAVRAYGKGAGGE